jgi:AcrR family transcriptional regulator
MTFMSAPNRREAAKEKNRALILSAARGVFDDLGYAQATVRDIVRATPLASGTFYNYFKSKEAIYQALRDDEALALRPLLSASRAAAGTAQEFIAGGFRLFFTAALSARVDVPPGGLKVRMDTPEILAGQSELEADIAAASEKGLLPKVEARLLAAALAGMAFELSGTLAGPEDVEPVTQFATALILAGLAGFGA